ncbi:MAG TPA: right-handed parallel beta-helix repeat-containing protein [Planctomycetota bacterium]|nr:right-handed parallel beta-helix repeat-containing protein [Planctomycetota bacterium]HRR78713.1 right-handed parallel beta-helix repeat-containing protein [Planctomycetota bacterium]HRT93821.1 right-handed parallel beta-helix repeat-containing protein [Planctomycetota bacterium]
MRITQDTVLPRGAVLGEPLVIAASGVTIDGNGATLAGPGRAGEPESFQGTGVVAKGCSGVTLRRLKVRGFRIGLAASDGSGWLIEDCDFSDNFTDPAAGWNVERRLGGLVLTRLTHSVLRRNTAQRVWNGLDLEGCDGNRIAGNAFSHCSNVCLKLWTSCRNVVTDNDLSWGLRIDPGEVHARDSAGVLLESGSDHNHFVGNDVTHGGDGIFLRCLNGWTCTGNVFIENDCSWANNNGFEAWNPGNAYLRNKANHCSHGFWLAGSDDTLLEGNEAAYNGCPDGPHNAPEKLFGHGGIVFVGAPASHCVARGNHCHHNNGAGIALRGDVASQGRTWRTFHWLLDGNRLEHNRWGIHAQHADLVHLAGNASEGNEHPDFFENVTRLTRSEGRAASPIVRLEGPSRALAGERLVFDASRSRDPEGRALAFAWDLAGVEAAAPVAEHVFAKPGFYRVALTASNGASASLAYRDVYVVRETEDAATEGSAGQPAAGVARAGRWSFHAPEGTRVVFRDSCEALVGRLSLEARVEPYAGGEVELLYSPDRPLDLRSKSRLAFWLRRRIEGVFGFKGANPVLRLYGPGGHVTCAPVGDANRIEHAENPNEAREGWLLLAIPLAGDAHWQRAAAGEGSLGAVERVGLQFRAANPAPFTLWLDGLFFE